LTCDWCTNVACTFDIGDDADRELAMAKLAAG
jgi:hypothetical protein